MIGNLVRHKRVRALTYMILSRYDIDERKLLLSGQTLKRKCQHLQSRNPCDQKSYRRKCSYRTNTFYLRTHEISKTCQLRNVLTTKKEVSFSADKRYMRINLTIEMKSDPSIVCPHRKSQIYREVNKWFLFAERHLISENLLRKKVDCTLSIKFRNLLSQKLSSSLQTRGSA